MTLAVQLGFAWLLAMLSACVVAVMIRVGTLDHPGERSSHTRPTPKGGGVGIVAAFLVGSVMVFLGAGHARIPAVPFLGLIGASVGIAVISYLDDVRSWSFTVKLGAQLAAAGLAIACGVRLRVVHFPLIGAVDTSSLGVPITAAWIMFATNAVNFIDGLNGLASGSVAIACLFLAGMASAQGDAFVYVAALMLAAGIFGFLPFNYPRARIFMGDVGSQFCGFVLAILGVMAAGFGPQTGSVLLVPMLLFGVWFDVVFTLLRRAIHGQRIYEAHRSHLYQVAHRCGMPAWMVTLVYWGMAAWGGGCCIEASQAGSAGHLVFPLLVMAPQIVWLMTVKRMSDGAKLTVW